MSCFCHVGKKADNYTPYSKERGLYCFTLVCPPVCPSVHNNFSHIFLSVLKDILFNLFLFLNKYKIVRHVDCQSDVHVNFSITPSLVFFNSLRFTSCITGVFQSGYVIRTCVPCVRHRCNRAVSVRGPGQCQCPYPQGICPPKSTMCDNSTCTFIYSIGTCDSKAFIFIVLCTFIWIYSVDLL